LVMLHSVQSSTIARKDRKKTYSLPLLLLYKRVSRTFHLSEEMTGPSVRTIELSLLVLACPFFLGLLMSCENVLKTDIKLLTRNSLYLLNQS
jgi:hypothetical protein